MGLMSFREPNRVKWVGSRPAHDGEQVWGSGNVSGNTITLYTVPDGKTLYITNYWGVANSTPHTGNFSMDIYDTGPSIVYNLLKGTNYNAKMACMGLYFPIELPAGFTVKIDSTIVGGYFSAGFVGWAEAN